MLTPGNLLRSLGFNGDGSEIWFSPSGNPAGEKVLMPLTGGTPRPFLGRGHSTPSWSPDDARLVYIGSSEPGDPLSLADRTGADPRPIVVPDQGKDAVFQERRAHTQSGVVTRRPMDLLRARDGPDSARWTCGACNPQANRRSSSHTRTHP